MSPRTEIEDSFVNTMLLRLFVGLLFVVYASAGSDLKPVIQKAYKSTVVLEHKDAGLCSAVIISRTDSEYRVLTAGHCVGEIETNVDDPFAYITGEPIETRLILNPNDTFYITSEVDEGWREEATLISVGDFSAGVDYAILSFQHCPELPVASLDSARLEMGDEVFAIGIPGGFLKIPLLGLVGRTNIGFWPWQHVLLLQMPGIISGSSGSPVFDSEGRVRAIIVGRDPENSAVGLALSISHFDLPL